MDDETWMFEGRVGGTVLSTSREPRGVWFIRRHAGRLWFQGLRGRQRETPPGTEVSTVLDPDELPSIKEWLQAGAPDDDIEVHPSSIAKKPGAKAGEYYPRIWRPGSLPPMLLPGTDEAADSVRAAELLVERLEDVFLTVEPRGANPTEPKCHDNLKVYGHRIREVFLLACTEVEAAFRGVLRVNGYAVAKEHATRDYECEARAQRRRFWTMEDYGSLREPMGLAQYEVQILGHTGIGPIAPFREWNSGLPWYKRHHSIKHDRHANFEQASLENAITAVCAVIVLLRAQFGPLSELLRMTGSGQRLARFVIGPRYPYFELGESYVALGTADTEWTPVPFFLRSSIG